MGTTKFNNIEKKDYVTAREQIKTFDFLFASGNSPMSKIIRVSTRSLMSHVGFIAIWNDRVLLFESVEDQGVRMIPLSQYIDNYEHQGVPYDGRLFIARYSPEIALSNIPILFGRAVDLLNRQYDKEEIAQILARITVHLKQLRRENDSYICSEYVEVCYSSIGIVFQHELNGFIYPESIAADAHVIPLCELALKPVDVKFKHITKIFPIGQK